MKKIMLASLLLAGVMGANAQIYNVAGGSILPNETTTNTNVGIGTNAPLSLLHLQKSYGSDVGIKLSQPGSSIWDIKNTATTGLFTIGAGGASYFNIDKMTGNIGIGITTPSTKLHIINGTDASLIPTSGYLIAGQVSGSNLVLDNNEIMARNNGVIAPLYLQNDGGDLFIHNNLGIDNRFSVLNNGKVGIGTTTPSEKLDVKGSVLATSFKKAGGTSSQFLMADGSTTTTANANTLYTADGTLSGARTITMGANPITFNGTGNYIINAGSVGIGTTTPKAKLEVVGNGLFQGGLFSSISNNEGGYISLNNPLKTATGLGSSWKIYNMTGSYGNSLQFYVYDNVGCVTGGLCDPRMTLLDSGNVGIGTTTPYTKLEVVGVISSGARPSESNLGMEFGGLLNPSALPSQIRGVIGALNSGTGVSAGSIGYQPRTGVNASHIFYNEQAETVRITSTGNVGIGTTDPKNKLSVNGTIWAKEVKVSLTDAADWVFDKNYKLKPLTEVEKYINENKHLPEVPSADEFRQNDMNVSEMSNKLLQKIEELTLYAIEQQKELNRLKTENENYKLLAERLSALEKELKK